MNALIEKACEITSQNQSFLNDYLQLTRNELSSLHKELTISQIAKLLKTASLFSLSCSDRFQKMAFKMAIFLFNQYRKDYESIPYAVELVLTRLGNLPGILTIVEKEEAIDCFGFFNEETQSENRLINYYQFPEILAKKITNITDVSGAKEPMVLTDFQSKIFFLLRIGKSVSFSAPTSAGKSFMVHKYIAEKIKESQTFNAVYIVPTRALIAEVQQSIRETILELGVNRTEFAIFVSANKLNMDEISEVQKKVFVLTQERLQEAMASDYPLTDINLLVVDEAQSVSHKVRGIVLQDAVDDLIALNDPMQKLFIAPFIENPNDLRIIFGAPENVIPEITSKSPVGQSIVAVNFEDDTITTSALSYELGNERKPLLIPLQTFEDKLIVDNDERKAWVAASLTTEKEPTVIYCNTPADCRAATQKIIERSNISYEDKLSSEILTAIEFFAKQVHEDYYLCDALKNGVGYHYGKMPQFIKFYVKDLFESNEIRILCCTSTLLEGVNLPAKNIILFNPRAGGHMSRLSLLNLAGRAGRLRKDYYGKIFCINLKEWQTKNSETIFCDKPERVESSAEKILDTNITLLIKYLENLAQPCPQYIASLATSLMMKMIKKPDGSVVSAFLKRSNVSIEDIQIILKALEQIRLKLSLRSDVILKHKSFDPRLQNELYVALKEIPITTLPFPADKNYEYFYPDMIRIFSYIAYYLLRDETHSWKYHGVLASEWIMEVPYRKILDGKINFCWRNDNETNKAFHNRMIEELDNDIEKTLRYDYARALKCYADIIRLILEQKKESWKHSCEELPIYLEYGCHNKNALFLLERGLSRNAAISISQLIKQEFSTSEQCVAWISGNFEDLIKKKVHTIFSKEVERLLERKKKSVHN